MGKSWKKGGEKSRPRALRTDLEQERRLCRERVRWGDLEEDDDEIATNIEGRVVSPFDQSDLSNAEARARELGYDASYDFQGELLGIRHPTKGVVLSAMLGNKEFTIAQGSAPDVEKAVALAKSLRTEIGRRRGP